MERDRQRLVREEGDRREMERKEEREKAEKAEKDRIRKEVERREEERKERERLEFERQLLAQHSRRSSLERSPPAARQKIRKEKRSEESASGTEGGETTAEENKKRKVREESPPKMKKKTRSNKPPEEEESDEMEIGEEKAPERRVYQVIKKMESWLERQAKQKTVSKVQLGEMLRLVGEMRKEVKEMELEKARLEGRVEQRREILGMLREMVKEGGMSEGVGRVEEGVSFAQVVRDERKERKRNPVVTGTRREPVKAPNVVIVRKEGKESEEVRKKMKEVIDPRREGINVRRMTKINNGKAQRK
ncbi:vicilin-like seed storage protein At2g18540 [Homalodisca vitripennis]|uniref:vicilin-like seed storage protein At2g18540 n=1 Tax=Homalodisca vitripennis TaxID=197043 RepID=UPI001EEAAC2E|nr:vicilin-like seed storage protein At2g18540 [Homalodisca vitripennis]